MFFTYCENDSYGNEESTFYVCEIREEIEDIEQLQRNFNEWVKTREGWQPRLGYASIDDFKEFMKSNGFHLKVTYPRKRPMTLSEMNREKPCVVGKSGTY